MLSVDRIKRIYHRSPAQTEESQSKGKQIMPGTRFTEFPAFYVDPRVRISRSAWKTDDLLFFLPIVKNGGQIRRSFGNFRYGG